MKNTLEFFNKLALSFIQDEEINTVAKHIPSEDLFEQLDLELNDEAIDEKVFKDLIKDLVFATPRTATKGFFNQLFGGRNEHAVLGELLSVVLNNSMYTYKAAGPMVGVEMVIINKLKKMLGWDDKAGGTLAAGGSLTNLMALIMARDVADKDIRFKGMKAKLVAYTSDSSHYSVPKNAAFAGVGREQVRFVSTDERGRMLTADLEKQIIKDKSDGFIPFLINSTAGTTVLGAFDPFEQISDIAQKYNIWHHSDGAYCGSILFSSKYKHYLKGVERADSFSLNAHKMLSTPLSCSIILVKDQQHLYDSFSQDASYLYQTDQDDFNPGKVSLQCGRRNDALKFWTLWKQIGTTGLEKMVDHQFNLADAARDYIKANPDYTLYSFEDSVSVCFNYKDIPARDICTKMYEMSELMVGYGSFREQEFIRLVTINAGNQVVDIINVFEKIEAFVTEHF